MFINRDSTTIVDINRGCDLYIILITKKGVRDVGQHRGRGRVAQMLNGAIDKWDDRHTRK